MIVSVCCCACYVSNGRSYSGALYVDVTKHEHMGDDENVHGVTIPEVFIGKVCMLLIKIKMSSINRFLVCGVLRQFTDSHYASIPILQSLQVL